MLGPVGGGAAIFSESMDWERACLVACHIGTIDWLLERAIDALRVFGGYGLMNEYGIESIVQDSVAGTICSGTSDIQRNIIARWLGIL